MATEPASAGDTTEIFQELENYPWDKDAEFQGGLSAILGTTTSPSQIETLTLRAQVFYLSRKRNIPIDFDAYKTYLSSKRGHQEPPQQQEQQPQSSGNPTVPETQQETPQSKTEPATAPAPAAPYPTSFAEIVSLITSGQPIPGIKEIPPTVLTSQATAPQAARRRKPWEVDEPAAGDGDEKKAEGTFGDRRDEVVVQEYPEED